MTLAFRQGTSYASIDFDGRTAIRLILEPCEPNDVCWTFPLLAQPREQLVMRTPGPLVIALPESTTDYWALADATLAEVRRKYWDVQITNDWEW